MFHGDAPGGRLYFYVDDYRSPITGNLSIRAGVNYTYGDTNHDHAVTQMGSDSYTYDANGNQITRNISGSSYTLSYDAENRLVGVSGAATVTFYYDGDGNRVKATVGTTTTTYVGGYFEWTGSTSTMIKYYYAGATRVAMRTGTSTINYLLGDHLGSQAITTDNNGLNPKEIRYYPWGNTRYTSGTTPTSFKFTGQRYESSIGLNFYGARWSPGRAPGTGDSSAGRFISADTVISDPGNSQTWDRYAYTANNPVKYTDPSGHYEQKNGYTHDYDEYTPQPRSKDYPINNYGGANCTLSLSKCFGDTVFLKGFSGNGEDNPIPIEEFEAFADKVAEDLYSHDLSWPGVAAGRHTYDTPFYNGGESERRTGDPNAPIGEYPSDQLVCIENIRCSGRAEINYIAQGMWGAAVGEPKLVSVAIAQSWKLVEYGDTASPDTIFWINYGYDYFQQWKEDNGK